MAHTNIGIGSCDIYNLKGFQNIVSTTIKFGSIWYTNYFGSNNNNIKMHKKDT